MIRAATEAGKLEALQCDEPSQEIFENGVEGYANLVEEENRVPVGSPNPALPLSKPKL